MADLDPVEGGRLSRGEQHADDPEIGAAWVERQHGRRATIHGLIESWPAGTLRAGLDAGRAADVAWALTSDEVHELFVGLRGWPPEVFLPWLRSTLAREILAELPPGS